MSADALLCDYASQEGSFRESGYGRYDRGDGGDRGYAQDRGNDRYGADVRILPAVIDLQF